MSLPDDLDSDVYSGRRTPRHTEDLVRLLDSRSLWTEYGIDDDIIVSPPTSFSPSGPIFLSIDSMFTAIYVGLPTC